MGRGCEDPRVAMTEDGTYVMLYTAWNRNIPRLAVAVSKDLKKWTKHGLALRKPIMGVLPIWRVSQLLL